MTRGSLRIYLGAAPGVGKTFAMLNEGQRRKDRGTDVVVGFVETHGRPNTAAQVADLEIVPRRTLVHRGGRFEEMDIDAVLARRPAQALVDELAHTNVPGSRNTKRWQDVEELLEAGIDVITTVNVQHLESLNDVVERITGIRQQGTVPDHVVRAADQIEIVDMTPEALRRRMAHGNIYKPDKVDAALANYFRVGNLSALRELALLWVADRVDEGLHAYMEAQGIDQVWETRERVVVAVTGAPGGDQLVRRAARMAARTKADLLAVHVRTDDGLAEIGGDAAARLDTCHTLVTDLGGTWHETVGSNVAEALCRFARSEQATQLVIGASRRTRVAEILRGSIVGAVVRHAGTIDVHVIATDPEAAGTDAVRLVPGVHRRGRSNLTAPRRTAGWAIAVLGVPLLTLALTHARSGFSLPGDMMAYLLVVLAAATTGGMGPALVSALGGSLAANWYFTPPIHTFTIEDAGNVVALIAFVAVGCIVSLLVTEAARRRVEAGRARAEAEVLARAAAELLSDDDPVPTMLRHVCSTFAVEAAAVLVPRRPGGGWIIESSHGLDPPVAPDAADHRVDLGDGATLALRGHPIGADDLRVLRAFCDQLAGARERHRLRADSARSAIIAEADALRTALLRAVSHDLRTPLASIKASVSSLLQHDVSWSPTDVDAFLTTIDEETDRLDNLVGNLLDMSRLQAGAVRPQQQLVAPEDVVAAAIASLSDPPTHIEVQVAETLPPVLADAALLERVLANVIGNAAHHTPPELPVVVEASVVGEALHIRVIDRGLGVPPVERDRLFEPFQRLGDRVGGVGLGLAVAKGFMTAMGGDILLEDTPGGGLTVDLVLNASPVAELAKPPVEASP
jgi:two-component system sensor histidine kinase KdpD